LKGEDEELTSILSNYPFLVDWRNKNKTPLHFAIEGKHLSTCEILLDLGANMFLAPINQVNRIVTFATL